MPLKLETIICSTRPGRIGAGIGEWFHDFATADASFECRLIDIADFNFPVYDEPHHPATGKYQHDHTRKWSQTINDADAYVFVIPEYNHCPPPSFVNALNYVYKEWNYKPCGFVGYGGAAGGVRSVSLAQQMVTTLKMMPIPESVMAPMAWNQIDDSGRFQSNELIDPSATKMLSELKKWAEALAAMR